MPQSNVLVVVIDGLRASALGAYGNTTYLTSALDHCAAHSLVFDACYAPAIELADVYSALWRSRYPSWATGPPNASVNTGCIPNLPLAFAENGYHTKLVTDEPQLLQFECGNDFHECLEVGGQNDDETLAADVTNTSLARLFAAAGEMIERSSAKDEVTADSQLNRPRLLWLHARGMFGPWDAPVGLQESLLDADDPPPIISAKAPNFRVSAGDDPDIVYQYGVAYVAQVMVVDECWRHLSQLLPPTDAADEWLVLLLGGRGYCLGEHQQIGGIDGRLPTEQLHVPWLIQVPGGRGQLARTSALVSHFDVLPTLLGWVENGSSVVSSMAGGSILPLAAPEQINWRTASLSLSRNDAYSIRYTSWTLRGVHAPQALEDANSGGSFTEEATAPELFVRPDDRWEANDVAKLCPEVVDELQHAAMSCLQQIHTGEVPTLMKVPD